MFHDWHTEVFCFLSPRIIFSTDTHLAVTVFTNTLTAIHFYRSNLPAISYRWVTRLKEKNKQKNFLTCHFFPSHHVVERCGTGRTFFPVIFWKKIYKPDLQFLPTNQTQPNRELVQLCNPCFKDRICNIHKFLLNSDTSGGKVSCSEQPAAPGCTHTLMDTSHIYVASASENQPKQWYMSWCEWPVMMTDEVSFAALVYYFDESSDSEQLIDQKKSLLC